MGRMSATVTRSSTSIGFTPCRKFWDEAIAIFKINVIKIMLLRIRSRPFPLDQVYDPRVRAGAKFAVTLYPHAHRVSNSQGQLGGS